jgi:hypothetical protein
MKQYNKVVSFIEKMEEDSKKRKIKENNALKGHEPKCKVCNSQYQKEIEYIYECNNPYKDIKAYLEDKEEFLSEMSISRHFKNHYPKRKAYFDNVKKMEDESIQDAIKWYPYLKDVFQEIISEWDYDKMVYNNDKGHYEEVIYKDRTKSDIFLHDHGYCLTEHRLCSKVPKKQVEYMEEILSIIDDNISELDDYSFDNSKKIDLLNKKIGCFECRDLTYNNRIDYMMHLLLKNIFNIEVESDKMNEFLDLTFDDLLFSEGVDYDFNKMDKILAKFKNGNSTETK